MNRRAGQSIIESIVALGILTVGLMGILGLLNQSIGLNRLISDNYTATYLAAEGIEVVHSILDANIIAGRPWNSALTDGMYELEYNSTALSPDQGRALGFDSVSKLYYYGAPRSTPFRRSIQISRQGAAELRVISRVSWIGRGNSNFEVVLEDRFFDWR
jgi:hypothetical protein